MGENEIDLPGANQRRPRNPDKLYCSKKRSLMVIVKDTVGDGRERRGHTAVR